MISEKATMIPVNRPWIGEEEKREVMRVLDENALTSAGYEGGKRVRDFELNMKNYLKIKHVVAVNSGTSALHAALLVAGVKHDDEVLLPSFTFVATANAVVAAGAKPVFVDIKRDDYTMDVIDLKSKINGNSKVIMPVHLYGHPSDMDEIIELADKHSLQIIEDACQSLGSSYKKKQTGTFGAMGCFSMYASKVLTAGEGGAITTNSDEMADKLRMIRNHGMVEGYDTRILGLNLRLPELSAAIAKVQMQKFQAMLDTRRRNAELLTKALLPLSSIGARKKKHAFRLPQETADKKFNWYLYTVAFQNNHSSYNGRSKTDNRNSRDIVRDRLVKDQIGATVYYNPPVHQTPYYKQLRPNMELPSTEWCAEHVLSLPVHPLVTISDIDRIARSMKLATED